MGYCKKKAKIINFIKKKNINEIINIKMEIIKIIKQKYFWIFIKAKNIYDKRIKSKIKKISKSYLKL